MKKTLLIILASVVGLLLVVYLVVGFFLGSIVKSAINHYGPAMTQTTVVLQGAEVSPFSGDGTLTGLVVGNPPGWTTDKAFSLGKIHVSVVPSSVFTDQIVINEIDIEDPIFVYETHFVSSNIGDLLSRIEGRQPGDTAQAATKSGKPLTFIVKHLVMRNGRVTVGVGSKVITFAMPPIELRDLGTPQAGLTSLELAKAVMKALAGNVVSATTQAAGKIGTTMGGAAADTVKGAASALQSMFHH